MSDADKPLTGWRVLITRPAEQIAGFAAALHDAGATPVPYPTIAVQPPPSWDPLDQALAELDAYPWVVFSSPSAVRFFLDRLGQRRRDSPASATASPLTGRHIAAVGTQTARALAAQGIAVAVVPDADQRQEGLADALAHLPAGTRVLFPQALGGREFLATRLQQQGCLVDVIPVSQTAPLLLGGEPPPFDVATFASPSAFRAFVAGHGTAALSGRLVAAIGPTTAAALTDAGVAVDLMPAVPSAAALVDALVQHRRKNPPAGL